MAQDETIELFRWVLVGRQYLFNKVGGGRAQKCQCLSSIWNRYSKEYYDSIWYTYSKEYIDSGWVNWTL